jgi:hypothetical protein
MVSQHKKNQITQGYIVTGRLHSEVLEDTYGPISVQVLSDDTITREVLLKDRLSIARTYAMTIRNGEWARNNEMQAVNKDIQAGEAIGKAFKSHGFSICKNIIDVYVVNLPEWMKTAFSHTSETAKARISEFLVKRNDLIFNYGLITEIYSPDFRKPVKNDQDSVQINLPSTILYDMGLTKQQVWKYIEDRGMRNGQASIHSSFLTSIKEKVNKTIR